MKLHAVMLSICVFVTIAKMPELTAQNAAAQTASPNSAFPSDQELLAMIAARVDEKRAVGIVLGVLDADGTARIVSYGSAGPQAAPLGPNTVFEIGSVTKVVTATVLAETAARGEVSLDAPVQRYLSGDLRLASRNGTDITLANLAEQNSGLPNLPDNYAPKDPANPFADYTIADLSRYLAGVTLPRAPGERYEYSNLGIGLLGLALSRHAGLSYEELIAQRVLRPLGMESTSVRPRADTRQLRAAGHDQQGAPTRDWEFSAPFEAAGALRSTMTDMLKFLDANIGEPKNDLERAMRVAQRPRAAAGNSRIGLNWLTTRTAGGVEVVSHTGNTGGFSSYIGFDPARRIGVVMLANQFGVTLDIPVHLLDPTVPLRAAPPTPAQLGAVDVPAEALARVVGVYTLDAPPRLRLAVSVENRQLLVEAPGLGKLPFYARTASTFFNTSMGAEISFVNDADGSVSGLVVRMGGVDQRGTKVE
jgi:serine-type D-Ala-D-Ala carboxypeptidase/endopeptidase